MKHSGMYFLCIILLFSIDLTVSSDRIYLYTKLLPLNTNKTDTTHAINTSYYEVTNSQTTPEFHNSTLTLIKLEACNENLNPHRNYTALDEAECGQRIERSVFGENNQILVDHAVYPNNALVSISHRCNGVAIGYRYVLTSAQCIYFSHYTYLRVYVMWVTNGVAIQKEVEFKKVLFPIEWIETKEFSERFKYNYALIELNTAQQTYIPIHMNTPTQNNSQCGLTIKQLSYNFLHELYDKSSISESTCSSRHETFSTTFLDCDSITSDLGNPLLTVVKRNGYYTRTVSGILLGNYGQYYLDHSIGYERFNLGLRINYEMFLRLCTWMNKLDWCLSYYRNYFPINSLGEIEL